MISSVFKDGRDRPRLLGMGALHLSLPPRPSPEDAVKVIHHALDRGIALLDTADSYCANESDKHHNEILIREALDCYPGGAGRIVVATKGGITRPNGQWICNGDPEYLRAAIRRSFEALGGKHPISLWQLHAPDPRFSIKQSLAPVAEAVRDGLVESVGLSNVSLHQIKEAQNVVQIAAVQNRYNVWHRDPEWSGILEYCDLAGMVFIPWGPLGGRNREYSTAQELHLESLAAKYQTTVHSILLAWLFAKSSCIVPIPGTSKGEHIDLWMDALQVTLTPQDVFRLECTVYSPAHAMHP
jgi:aryl-alcohol dehydrogenase-like predicted oxidoreductase